MAPKYTLNVEQNGTGSDKGEDDACWGLFAHVSLLASSPIWASETSLARTRERAAKQYGRRFKSKRNENQSSEFLSERTR